MTSCRETIEHCNPDSLAGDSHTGEAGRELGTCWRQLERQGTERGRQRHGVAMFATLPQLFWNKLRVRRAVRGSESRLFGVLALFYRLEVPQRFEADFGAAPQSL